MLLGDLKTLAPSLHDRTGVCFSKTNLSGYRLCKSLQSLTLVHESGLPVRTDKTCAKTEANIDK
jgi:hypothetical protein